MGGEGPRVIEHNTRQLMAAPGFFFVLTLKGDLRRIGSRKGFSLGNAIHYISNPV